MRFTGDFHIHSRYSRATSKNLIPEHLDFWARVKGIKVIGTGDFTHPGWLKELKEKFEPADQGLFRLKDEYRLEALPQAPVPPDNEVRFLLTSEISTIYKKQGKVRKVHTVLFAPDFETTEKIQKALTKIGGNITSDGRPILGMDSRDLVEIGLTASGKTFFVPAHIWTPWFSALGSQSGFDTIDECYGDLSDHIFAVETGLSSDPAMNWMCSFLDKYTLISNSDAHSPEKLGREANLFDTELSYGAIIRAIKTGNPEHFPGTVEFFPQEGKYHFDGHRKCEVCWDPMETLKNNEICPVCGRKVTVGVMNRVAQLSDREDITKRNNRIPFHSVIPLKEILSEIAGVGPGSKQVTQMYNSLLKKAGTEFDILLNLPVEEIKRSGNDVLYEAIRRMRNGEIFIKEGFDGEYGQIKIFRENEARSFSPEGSLFKELVREKRPRIQKRKMIGFDLAEYRETMKTHGRKTPVADISQGPAARISETPVEDLNPEQKKATEHCSGPALIIAGPGTGKTRTLTRRIADLIRKKGIDPENILAVTFTNKAAEEIVGRLKVLLGGAGCASNPVVSTFHALGFSILKEYSEKTGRDKNFCIIDEDDKRALLQKRIGCLKKEVKSVSAKITGAKQDLRSPDEIEDKKLAEIFSRYEKILREENIFDLDDLIYQPVKLFTLYPEILSRRREQYKWIMIDEYQDINFSQYQMVRKLMPGPGSNLCAIGDPDQAIYGFRGANVKFIRQFVDDYPDASVYTLKKSYRCSDFILQASSGVIRNATPEDKTLEGLQKGVKVKIVKNTSDKSEAEFVARSIEKMLGGLGFFSIDSGVTQGDRHPEVNSLSDFVVLSRIKQQQEALEKAFNDHLIPYQTIGDVPFFRQEAVRPVIDMLKLSINPKISLLKKKLMEKKLISQPEFAELRNLVKDRSVKNKVTSLIDEYFNSERAENETLFKKLVDLAHDFGNDLEGFLKFAVLGTGADTYRQNLEKVTLMTLHAAKGLEFNCVFIVGCEDGLIPYSLFENQKSDPGEERRLLYVGMTRAKKFLFLSHADKRFIHGREYRLRKSPYLNSIEEELIELSKTEHRKKEKKEDTQLTLFD